mgnify:CR=1 FL=1
MTVSVRLVTLPAAYTPAIGVTNTSANGRHASTMRRATGPLTTGQTDQGGEGMRFMGYTVYDGLINWDLSKADKASDLVPGLARHPGISFVAGVDEAHTPWAIGAEGREKGSALPS